MQFSQLSYQLMAEDILSKAYQINVKALQDN
jgi:hypothetical protein